ncbi:Porphyrin biosynthetic protein [Salmonella enterica subsp. enterica]|nr:Porphyrin biosynthetic protein [Salmonella enterica subsp. enterica]
MMLKVLLLFVLLLAGIVVGPMIAGHQGYVLIQTDNYNIETSVTGLAIHSHRRYGGAIRH